MKNYDSIEEFDGEAYCVMRSMERSRPVIQESWFPTGMNAHGLKRGYGDEIIGRRLEYRQGTGFYFRTETGGEIHVPTTSHYSTRYVEVPIAPPKSRLPIEWRDGQWYKETKWGWRPWWQK